MKHKTELALPAGSLQCALHAFKGGADAVYLGLKSFSARTGAVNFSFEDLRKLKAYCQENDKKFYIALNTLVKDQDLPEVIQLLKQIDYVKPDGIIVQDLGIASIIKKDFPTFELHGSTQLAVHPINHTILSICTAKSLYPWRPMLWFFRPLYGKPSHNRTQCQLRSLRTNLPHLVHM